MPRRFSFLMPMYVTSLDHLVLTVADANVTAEFYARVMGMEARSFIAADQTERRALYFGHQKINLHEVGREFDPKAKHPTAGSGDLCFLAEGTIEDWLRHLDSQSVTVEDGPVPRSGATGPITSLYFRDPDSNLIEVSIPDQTK